MPLFDRLPESKAGHGEPRHLDMPVRVRARQRQTIYASKDPARHHFLSIRDHVFNRKMEVGEDAADPGNMLFEVFEGANLGEVRIMESVVWLVGQGDAYLQRAGSDFSAEVQRKRLKFGLQAR